MSILFRMALALLTLSGSPQAAADDSREADRAALRDRLATIESALNDKAFEQVIPLLGEDSVLIFLNAEVARGVEQARAYFDKTLGSSNPILSDYTTKAVVAAPARFIGDIAIADGSTQDTFVFANGSDMVIDTKWTVTLQKQDDDWKILQLQFSSNLFDNPLVNNAKNNLIMFTVISALAGILIGFLAGRRRKAND